MATILFRLQQGFEPGSKKSTSPFLTIPLKPAAVAVKHGPLATLPLLDVTGCSMASTGSVGSDVPEQLEVQLRRLEIQQGTHSMSSSRPQLNRLYRLQ
jgi:hypothetical protein